MSAETLPADTMASSSSRMASSRFTATMLGTMAFSTTMSRIFMDASSLVRTRGNYCGCL